MQIIYTADNAIEAHVITHMLEQAGIHAIINGEFLQSAAGELPAAGNIKISVPNDDVHKARELIDEWDKHSLNPEPYEKHKSQTPKENGHSFKTVILAFITGLFLSSLYFYVPVNNEGDDYNRDGILDTMFYYTAHGILKKVTIDVNFDEKIDRIEYSDPSGFIEHAKEDTNYDGYFDTLSKYENGNISKTTVDYNKDKRADRTYIYDKNGQLRTMYYHHEKTENIIKISDFENARLISSRLDENNDEIMDVKYTYDIYENILSKIELK